MIDGKGREEKLIDKIEEMLERLVEEENKEEGARSSLSGLDPTAPHFIEVNMKQEEKQSPRVCILQPHLRKDMFKESKEGLLRLTDSSTKQIIMLVNKAFASKQKIDALVLPELILNEKLFNFLKSIVVKKRVIVIGGSWYNSNSRISEAIIIVPASNRDAECYWTQKHNLSYLEKSSVAGRGATAGKEIYVFKNTLIGSFAVVICLDFLDSRIRTPLCEAKLDFLFVISLNPKSSRFYEVASPCCKNNSEGIYICYVNSYIKSKDFSADGRSACFGVSEKNYLDHVAGIGLRTTGDPGCLLFKLEEKYSLAVVEFDIRHKKVTLPHTIDSAPNFKLLYYYPKKEEINTKT